MMKAIKWINLKFVICIMLISGLFAAERIAVTTKVTGNVDYTPVNKSLTDLKPGAVLANGDKIKTGSNGFVALVFIDDKSALKIKENTELEITGKREASSIAKKINMGQGTLRAKVTKQTKSDFVIQTPTSVASVKGTDFWLISDPLAGDRLIGLEGIVSFTNIMSGMTMDITTGLTGNSSKDGKLETGTTNPDAIPTDPEGDEEDTKKSELRIRLQGPDGTIKTLIIEYQ